MSWKIVKIGSVLKQYRIEHWVQNDKIYKQVSILNDGSVILRGEKIGKEIGRKRQFLIDTNKYPKTLIFTRQLLLQGSIGIANGNVNGCIATENMPMFSIEGIEPDFLSFFIKTELFKSQVRSLETSGTAQKSLHERQFLSLEIPLPSLKEQQEIISASKSAEKINNDIMEEIVLQQTHLQQLRQAILQEAVQGKLTKQNKDDEPADKLLQRIKTEKQKLIITGKLKKEKELPPIADDEIPFELPKGWVWCRLGEICVKIGSGSTPRGGREVYTPAGIKFIRSQNVYDEGLIFDNVAYIDEATHKKMEGTKILPNDILLNITGGSIGRCALVPSDFDEANVSQHVTIVRTVSLVNKEFIHQLILSPYFQDYIMATQTGGNREGLAKKNMELMLIPLLPLAEQQSIVGKVQQLLQMVKQLEQQVAHSQTQAQQLLQAVLNEAFTIKEKEYEEYKAAVIPVERKVLAGWIIQMSNDNSKFGVTMFQKNLHVCEYVAEVEYETNYSQNRAGPDDRQFMKAFLEEMVEKKWYQQEQKFKLIRFVPDENAGKLVKNYGDYFKSKARKISFVLQLLKDKSLDDAELISTLYAVWNNRILRKEVIEPDLLANDVFSWSEEKGKYTRAEIKIMYDWMNEKGLVPVGFGKEIKKQ